VNLFSVAHEYYKFRGGWGLIKKAEGLKEILREKKHDKGGIRGTAFWK